MTEAHSQQSSPAKAVTHAEELADLRQRILADSVVASQLRSGGEPGLLGATGVDDETLLRWLKAEKYVSTSMLPSEVLQNVQTVPVVPVDYCRSLDTLLSCLSVLVIFNRYSVSKAEKRIKAHAAWRKEYVPLGRIQEVRPLVHINISSNCSLLLGCMDLIPACRARFSQSWMQKKPFCKGVINLAGLCQYVSSTGTANQKGSWTRPSDT